MFDAGFQMQNYNISDAFDDPDQEFIENVTNVLDGDEIEISQPTEHRWKLVDNVLAIDWITVSAISSRDLGISVL